jgi:hypothetical protein
MPMFIVWKRQRLTHTYSTDWKTKYDRWQLGASLSESRRIDGKPRRRLMAHLGHIEEARIAHDADRAVFWYRADRTLDELSIDDDERRRLEEKLLDRVPRPGPGLADHNEFLDLVTQDIDAAAAWARSVPDEDEVGRRLRIVRYVKQHRAAQAEYERWWSKLTRQMERKHRAQLDDYAQDHDIETKPFDYSRLDPETAQMMREAAARIKTLTE